MKVLVGCEYSGIVRQAFREKGHDAWSCDILPSDDNSPYHIQGDVRDLLEENFDLGIFHPPCTRLTLAGVRWLHERNLWEELDEACEFFKMFINAAPRVAIENPQPHRYAVERIGKNYDQKIQPWQFGHGETKGICLWLYNLPKLEPTNIVEGREAKVHKMPPSAERTKMRSRFFEGVGEGMVNQWGKL